jgi:hypothetical protein
VFDSVVPQAAALNTPLKGVRSRNAIDGDLEDGHRDARESGSGAGVTAPRRAK